MATVRVIDIIDRARRMLHDPTKTGWSDAELLDWFNAAQVALITMRPDALTKCAKFLCDQKTRQSLPAEAIRLIRVDRNSAGGAIRYISRDELNHQLPEWHDDSFPVEDVELYIFDPKEPKAFYVYPVPVSGHPIELIYSYAPKPISINDFSNDLTVIAVDDSFQDAIYDYLMFRACSKDSDHADGAQRAGLHFQSFTSFLQGKYDSDAGIKPDV